MAVDFALSAAGTSVVQESESSSLPLPWAVGDYLDVDLLYTPA